MLKRYRLLMISIFIGVIGISITPFFDSVVVTPDYDLTKHRLGLPLPIIEQNTWLTPLDDAFPFELGLVSPQENPTKILIGNYLLLVVAAVGTVYMILVWMKGLSKRIR
ncbi:hypothetical protein [Mesobacillus jeotgali]|jgi:hypothetical protein|uniref:DUF4306 domain-containing protein n=1 Tax=Mesobacillus jeotgali TaxID=129985 RepID=A0ABY9VL89_9BACI|nr:hypothetical protein [Mesobacillus jeotgali]WNF24628.1 hypothetical protein RH061_09135 [Mesobacillus jeotgali]